MVFVETLALKFLKNDHFLILYQHVLEDRISFAIVRINFEPKLDAQIIFDNSERVLEQISFIDDDLVGDISIVPYKKKFVIC